MENQQLKALLTAGEWRMDEYRVELWPRNRGPQQIPAITVAADGDFFAAALAIKHFKALGEVLDDDKSSLSIRKLPDGPENSESIKMVLGWLARPQRTKFVEENGLTGLLTS
ncbi:MAG: hypothetical protein U0163_00245 [Gemmatimonadaceae bacterium]